MEDYPEIVKKLKGAHRDWSFKKINGRVYVYKEKSIWDKTIKRRRTISTYIGKVTIDGLLMKKKASAKDNLRVAEELIKKRGGEVVWHLAKGITQTEPPSDTISEKLITAISTNARSTIKELSKAVGVSEAAILYHLKKLERQYGIKYTIDTYAAYNFGFYRFIITVKFEGQRPPAEAMRKVLETDPHVQLVMLTKGEFDIFMYVLFDNTLNLETWLYALRKNPVFSEHVSSWNISYFLIGHGIVQLRDEFFEKVVKERVWHRTKETPRRQKGQIFYREYAVLRALNKDGSSSFKSIDEEYNLNRGGAQHTFHELVKNEVIRRVTISMRNPPVKSLAIITLNQKNIKDFEGTKKEYYKFILQDKGLPTNRFVLTGDIATPYGILLILPIFNFGDLEKTIEELKTNVKGIEAKTTFISDIIVGSICYNKIAEKETRHYKLLTESKD